MICRLIDLGTTPLSTTPGIKCNYEAGTQFGTRGAIWFTNAKSGYYSMGVTVDDSTSSVEVNISGSAYGCRDMAEISQHVYATNVTPSETNGWRLTSLSSTTLDRGSLPNPAEQEILRYGRLYWGKSERVRVGNQ